MQNSNIKLIEGKIASVKKQVSALMDLYSTGTIDIDDIKAKIEPLNTEREKLEETLETLKHSKKKKEPEVVLGLVERFEKAHEENDTPTINKMLHELIERIIIDQETVVIHWNF